MAGNQLGQAYEHIYANAALVVAGKVGIVPILGNLTLDIYQSFSRGAESKAEVRDDLAGIRVGRQINSFISGDQEADRLRSNLFGILCSF